MGNGLYIEAGLGYLHNLAAGNANNIIIVQVPGVPADVISYRNRAAGTVFSPYIGVGYRWQLSPLWSVSAGGSIADYNLDQAGSYTDGETTNYHYNIGALLVNSVERVYYQVSQKNYLYGQLQLGLARLKGENFSLDIDPGYREHYNGDTVNRFDYGVGLGWQRRVAPKTNLNVTINYLNLGDSFLGTRRRDGGVPYYTGGQLKQAVHGIGVNVGLVHYF